MKILKTINRLYSLTSQQRFYKYLLKKGIKIGKGCEFYGLPDITIDLTRPSLIEIGDNVIFTKGVIILTHGYDWAVIREHFGDILGYAKPVIIKNNVFLGIRSVVMPGVVINENCIVATGSIVTKSTDSNSVYAGIPAKKIMSLDEYYLKRKNAQLEEATVFALSIIKNFNREPRPSDFREFFPLFLSRDNDDFLGIPVKQQTKNKHSEYLQSKSLFKSFEDFMNYIKSI